MEITGVSETIKLQSCLLASDGKLQINRFGAGDIKFMASPHSRSASRQADGGSGLVDGKISSPSSSPVMSGQRAAAGGRIGLSEYTAQRLAELKARRAEAEAEYKQQSPVTHRDPPTAGQSSVSTLSIRTTTSEHNIPPTVGLTNPKASSTGGGISKSGETFHATPPTKTSSNGESSSEKVAYVSAPAAVAAAARRAQPPPPPPPDATAAMVKQADQSPAPPIINRSVNLLQTSSGTNESAKECSSGINSRSENGTLMMSCSTSFRSPSSNKKLSAPSSYSATSYTPSPSHSRSGPISEDDDDDIIGFASLPEQVHRKAVKRGFDFTLMVVGESGLGKSTLVSCLFMNNELYKGRNPPNAHDGISRTVTIDKKCMDIEEKGVRLRLTIVDTPGFNDMVDANDCWKPIDEYIDQQYDQYFKDESGLNRKNIKDTRVHCCIYFISPYCHGLRQIDVELLKRLQSKVNLVPVIGKSDTLTPIEMKRLKNRIRADIEKHAIRIYEFPECDSDEDEDFKKQDAELKAAVPFAVIGSNSVVEIGGKKVRGRLYPWGIVEVDNQDHSDFSKLRQFLISTHMQDLKDVTRDVHYENFRARHIQEQMTKSQKERNKLKRDSTPNFDAVINADELLQQKDQEIQEMREMLKKMQSQLAVTGVNQVKGLGNL